MSDYLTAKQYEQLVGGINPNRVGSDGKGFSHVEAYEIRAHLNRLFGFARWSAEVVDQQPIFEQETIGAKEGDRSKWTVAYRTLLRLTVCAPDGDVLATYTEGATGDASNQPSRADAHDLALKTSESQALKRAAANLGDQFGLSLYRKGSREPLVGRSLIVPSTGPDAGANVAVQSGDGGAPADGEAASGPVDGHIDQPLPPESEEQNATEERKPSQRTSTPPPSEEARAAKGKDAAEAIRFAALDLAASVQPKAERKAALSRLVARAGAERVLKTEVANAEGVAVTVGALLEQVAKAIVNGHAAA